MARSVPGLMGSQMSAFVASALKRGSMTMVLQPLARSSATQRPEVEGECQAGPVPHMT